MTSTLDRAERTAPQGPKPVISGRRQAWAQVAVYAFVAVPMLALIAAIPLAWGWGLGWHDVILAVAFYYISGLGIAMGFHRYFIHPSFKATAGVRIALAIAGSLAVEGPVINWVADHRRHHKYS